MRTCPYCGQEAMTRLRKSALGPMFSLPCKACGKRVSVNPRGVLAIVPVFGGFAIAAYLHWSPMVFAAVIAGFVATFLIHEYAVPLVRRDA